MTKIDGFRKNGMTNGFLHHLLLKKAWLFRGYLDGVGDSAEKFWIQLNSEMPEVKVVKAYWSLILKAKAVTAHTVADCNN